MGLGAFGIFLQSRDGEGQAAPIGGIELSRALLLPAPATATETPITTAEAMTTSAVTPRWEAYSARPVDPRLPFPERDESRLYTEYIVQPGDTLGVIADHFAISVDDLFWSNPGLADADLIIEGETIKIPSLDGIVHYSVGGETVFDVAVKYGVSVESLTWFTPNQTPQAFQVLANGTEVLVLHANPPIADEAPPPAEVAPATEPPAEGDDGGTIVDASDSPDATPTTEPEPAEQDAVQTPGACFSTNESAPCFIWPINGIVTSPFGPRSDVGFHDGIDIDVRPDGDHKQVMAAAAGEVTWSGCDDRGYGCYVIVDHGAGWTTRYDHFSEVFVSAGQHVEQGTVLGLTGCTGYCRGEHLHFAILFEGKAVNPIDYLPPKESTIP
jgi:murein DD-endopeptidase MepM/ murein hydrolase activator NlpD